MQARGIRSILFSCSLLMFPCAIAELASAADFSTLAAAVPSADDFTTEGLRRYQAALRDLYGGDDGQVPLDTKAEFFEWTIARYFLTSYNQVPHTVGLSKKPGRRPVPAFGDDTSTWNGALLAALSYKYAVTRDRNTLQLIERLVDGMHLYQEVTGVPGLAARCVIESPKPVERATERYDSPDGRVFHFRSEAAKGTFNQIAGGYAALMMFAFDDLPRQSQQTAQRDLTALVLHLVDNDYRLRDRDGSRTEYGNLTPLLGTIGIPFNAQVAYSIVAAGHTFPPKNETQAARIAKAFSHLRDKHHVYYENPLKSFIQPQTVGNSPFVKGMNDRNHVHNAAFSGLMLELHNSRKTGREPDRQFLYELGQSMYWTMQNIQHERNALCNFMWAGILTDQNAYRAIVPAGRDATEQQLQAAVLTGIEQLRRFPLDRFYFPGEKVDTRELQWVDAQRPHEVYFWKAGPYYRYKITGPPTEQVNASIDYLYAFWVMRYFQLYERYYLRAAASRVSPYYRY